MKLLPILWAEPPTPEDWQRLSEARIALGHTDLIKPAEALPGSPGPILAVGAYPAWLTMFAHVESTGDPGLQDALELCLAESPTTDKAVIAALLSHWMGVEVKQVGEEEYVGGVQFT